MLASIIVWAGGAAAWGQGTGREFSVEAMRAETRVALVIGDGTYDGSPLRDPVSDACAMARALRELRFEITAIENATQREMRLSIIRFGDRLRGGGVGRFFFAGRRGQVGGKNFMIPVGAAIPAERVVRARSLPSTARWRSSRRLSRKPPVAGRTPSAGRSGTGPIAA